MAEKTPVVRLKQPLCRFLNFILVILALNGLSSVILWLVGGDSDYLERNVEHFHIDKSVFDIAVIDFLKSIILIWFYMKLETLSIKMGFDVMNTELKGSRSLYFFLTFVLTVGSLAYSTTKGILIYLSWHKHGKAMHIMYYAATITSFAFGIIEVLIFIANVLVLRKLRLQCLALDAEKGQSSTEGEKKEKKKVNIARLAKLAKPEGWIIFFGTIGLLGSTGSNMIAPLYFGKVIDAAVKPTMRRKIHSRSASCHYRPKQSKGRFNGKKRTVNESYARKMNIITIISTIYDLNKTILILFIIYTIGGVAAFFRAWLYTLAGQRLVARLRKELFAQILSQEIAFFDLNRTGELMNRLSSDSQVIQNAATVNISMLFRYFLQVVGSLAIMFAVSPKLTGVLLSVVPLVAIGAQQYGSFVRDLQQKFQDELANASTTAEESISSIRTVKSFSQEPKSVGLYSRDIDKSFHCGKKLALASGLFNALMSIVAQGAIVLVLWYGGKLVHDGGFSVGKLTSFMLYALNIAMAFAFLSALYGDFMKAVGASIRIFDLFDRMPAIKPGSIYLQNMKGAEIQFNEVDFRYPSRPETDVLKGLTFNIKSGETIALVGPSGGGKSTIISMIERFYDPEQGEIVIGGVKLSELDTAWFRKKIGIVSQEPVLFATTIGENIAYGRDATQEEIEEAAKQANAHEFITTFDEGYATTVGERGVKLSGGQKQRVAIARALLMDPDILLLDEATSALDAESEHLVKEAIDRAMVGRTVLVIAHRLSTVRNASRVIVINKGRIAEQGTHDELIEKDGVYKKLVLRQLNAGDKGASDWSAAGTPIGTPQMLRKKLGKKPEKAAEASEGEESSTDDSR